MRRRTLGRTIACGIAWSALASPSWAGIVCPPIDIAPTSNVAGSLMPGDCTDPGDGSFVDLYRVTLPTDGFLTVSLSSASFDAFLSVVDEGFTTLIAGDDDAGPGSDSLISLQPISAGTYIIVANSFNAGETGPYTLATSLETQGNPACAVQIALPPHRGG